VKHKFVLFIIGLLVLIMGAVPLISNIIPAVAGLSEGFPAPGTMPYQVLITALGLLGVLYGLQKEKPKQSDTDKALAKLLGK